MSQYYDTDALIDSIKRRINIPSSQITFNDTDLLAFANEEMSLSVVPALMSLHEDYLLYSEDQACSSTAIYSIPYRAVGNKLYDLQYVDASNNPYPMTRTTESAAPDFRSAISTNQLYAYYIKNNRIVPLPDSSGFTAGSLRYLYFIKPAQLVSISRIGVISSINRVTGDIVVSNSTFPSHFSTTISYDLYKVKSPHSILAIDLSASAINTTTKTITLTPAAIPAELAVGDHISMATEASIPQIPSDLHVLLAQKVAERVLEAQGDTEGLQAAKIKTSEMENRAGNIIDNRVDESPPKLVNRNGVLQQGLKSRYFRRGT